MRDALNWSCDLRANAKLRRKRLTDSVFPGLAFIEKLQNYDLTITSFVALRRPNNDHLKVLRMTRFRFCVVLS